MPCDVDPSHRRADFEASNPGDEPAAQDVRCQGVAIRPPPEMPKRRFIGARVVDPRRVLRPVQGLRSLDFASLYPSIVRAYNLCYQTWIEPSQIDKVRASFPELEIVSCELDLGQVWEELGAGATRGGRAHAEHRQARRSDAEAAQGRLRRRDLTNDEFEKAVAPITLHPSARSSSGATT